MHHCNKEQDINTIKKVLYGNGKKGLITMTSDLYNKVDTITTAVNSIQSDVKVLLQFQTQIEVKEQQEEKFDKKMDRLKQGAIVNKRWRVGLTISTILGLLAIIVSLLTIVYNPREKVSKGVTEEEFKELWEKYKDEQNPRGIAFVDSIN